MKFKFLSFLFLLQTTAFAQGIITVSTNPRMDTDYHDLQDAFDAAVDGDTIYVHGNAFYSGNFTVSKKVHIIGPGHHLIENNIYNTDGENAMVKKIKFLPGSDSSIIEGLQIVDNIEISVNDLHVRKNWFSYRFTSFGSIEFMEDVSSCIVYNNFFTNRDGNIIDAHSSVDTVKALFSNNILQGSMSLPSTVDEVDLTIIHNVFPERSVLNIRNAYVAKNIFIETSINLSNNVFAENNIFRGNLPTGALAMNNNIPNIDMNTVFLNFTSATSNFSETNFVELEPAPNPATMNCDGGCGATLGMNPRYRLSGVPELPILYELISPSEPDSLGQLHVQIRAKSF